MEFYNTDVSLSAKKYANDVLDSGYLNQGKYVKELEESILPKYTYTYYPTLTNSCTAALHIALEIANVRGKKVILPAKTFIATGMAVKMAGGIPIFADVAFDSKNITLETVEHLIDSDTAAVIGVSWGGLSCLKELARIKKKYNVYTIEDAAHAFGTYDLGASYVDFRCYSFQAIKPLSCGDGGIIASRYMKDNLKARAYRWFGINKDKMTFSETGERRMQVECYGYKYNMNDLNAAILRGNIEDFDKNWDSRCKISAMYNSSLGITDSYMPLEHSRWLYGMNVKNSNEWIKKANKLGIPARKMDKNISGHFGFTGGTLLTTDYIDETEIYIPCHHALTYGNVSDIITFLEEIKKSGDLLIYDKLLS